MVSYKRVWFEHCELGLAEFRSTQLNYPRLGLRLDRCGLLELAHPDPRLRRSLVDGIRGVDGLHRPIMGRKRTIPLAQVMLALHRVVIDDGGDDSAEVLPKP